jgi:pentatricopeptide repeat protein
MMAMEMDGTEARDVKHRAAGGERGYGYGYGASRRRDDDDDDAARGIAIVASLKDCAKRKDIQKGIQIHAHAREDGTLHRNAFVGNSLMNMYAKCGHLSKAREVFDELKQLRTLVLWSTLIAAYSSHGYGEEALEAFEQMQKDGFSPSPSTFVSVLKACGHVGAIDKGFQLHSMILKDRFLLRSNLVLGNALVDMYAKCGALDKAEEVFEGLPMLDVISWTSLISGYASHGFNEAALSCFSRMLDRGFSPNAVTFACALKACGACGDIAKGEDIHARVLRDGFLDRTNSNTSASMVGNALVDMYAKCGMLEKAQQVFESLPDRDVVSWNVIISGYIRHGHSAAALKLFDRMRSEGVRPDTGTYTCSLKACSNVGAVEKGKEIHEEAMRQQMGGHIAISTVLVDMYVKSGSMSKAREAFDMLPLRDVVLWSVLISGYIHHAFAEEALDCFDRMIADGFAPDEGTSINALKACSSLGASDRGREVHANMVKDGMLEQGTVIGNALIDMYADLGMHEEAQDVFEKLPIRDIVSWTALMAGYALLGMEGTVFRMFHEMIEDGEEEPDSAAFTLLLNACNHAGLVDRGQMCFEAMSSSSSSGYGVVCALGHYTCMVDLLGRAGQLDKAAMLVEEMPFLGSLTLWHIILGACQKCWNVEIAWLAFENAIQLDGQDPAAYVCMSNIYAGAAAAATAEAS